MEREREKWIVKSEKFATAFEREKWIVKSEKFATAIGREKWIVKSEKFATAIGREKWIVKSEKFLSVASLGESERSSSEDVSAFSRVRIKNSTFGSWYDKDKNNKNTTHDGCGL